MPSQILPSARIMITFVHSFIHLYININVKRKKTGLPLTNHQRRHGHFMIYGNKKGKGKPKVREMVR